ncbi:transcription-repair coupling factor, partial [Cyclobacteriaceae bacterium]|nr:transcription-repair coupling factor [Cyclobacteriaceae bacterium]
MKAKDILQIYKASPFLSLLKEHLKKENARVQLKNLNGSADAVVASTYIADSNDNHLLIVRDREEANYLQNDLENLLGKNVFLFPGSYKRPYHFEEVDNANILQRAEVLKQINEHRKGTIVVSYPDALSEKVVNKKSLVKNTFGLKVGDEISTEFISEVLHEYGFEKTDFVYEAGNFSIRGGIIDVYSYANELPYRIELLGKEVETIRTFDPETQLSEESKSAISIIPDIQTKLLQESRESFLDYLPENTLIWMNDVSFTNEIIQKCFDKIEEDIDIVRENSGESSLITSPTDLFDDKDTFQKLLDTRKVIEFGTKSHFRSAEKIELNIKSQPNFNKNFELLTQDLHDFQTQGYRTIICSESSRHLDK